MALSKTLSLNVLLLSNLDPKMKDRIHLWTTYCNGLGLHTHFHKHFKTLTSDAQSNVKKYKFKFVVKCKDCTLEFLYFENFDLAVF